MTGTAGGPQQDRISAKATAGRRLRDCLAAAMMVVSADVALSDVVPGLYSTGSDNSVAFVELLNRGTETVDLGGWQPPRGILFFFPQRTFLAPGQAIAVAADAAVLRVRNFGVPAHRIIGNFTGNLSDGGEELELARPALQSVLINGVPTTRPVPVPVERFI